MKKLLLLVMAVMMVGCSWHDNASWKGTWLDFRSEEERHAYELEELLSAQRAGRHGPGLWAHFSFHYLRGEEPQIAARDDYPLKRNYGIKRITDDPLRVDDVWVPRLPLYYDWWYERDYGIKRITDDPLRAHGFWVPRVPRLSFSAPLLDQQEKLGPFLDYWLAPRIDTIGIPPVFPTFPVFPR